MQQILLNLQSNALKFTPRDGKVCIQAEYLKSNQIGEEDQVMISVSDNGEGIDKVNHSKLFKVFGVVRDVARGTNVRGVGLGLAISKMIVTKMDGHIDFFSDREKGSTFFFTFKVKDFEQSEVEQMRQTIEHIPQQPVKR
jgi:K+-sensing histidine kinase KdpD